MFLVKEDIDPNIDQESNAQKAHRTYLKGRALNVVSDHSPEAEQLLSKAVKLGEFFYLLKLKKLRDFWQIFSFFLKGESF